MDGLEKKKKSHTRFGKALVLFVVLVFSFCVFNLDHLESAWS